MKVKVKLKQTIRNGSKKRYEYKVVPAEFKGDWSKQADHKAFREMIRSKYSGLTIVIYGPVK